LITKIYLAPTRYWKFSNVLMLPLKKEDGEVPKAAILWNPQGSRKRGRPKSSWRRSVTKEAGRSWNELRFLAADRQKWKELIDNLCS
jgi:hypothetical protein